MRTNDEEGASRATDETENARLLRKERKGEKAAALAAILPQLVRTMREWLRNIRAAFHEKERKEMGW